MALDVNPLCLAVIASREKAAQARAVERALREASPADKAILAGPVTSPGDRLRMRGVPITARGVGGTQPNTDPLAEVLRREAQRERQRQRAT